MDHVAIMRKSWRLTGKILGGKKTIESRWYKSRQAPWDKIRRGETVFFKDSGEPVSLRAQVEKVIQFSDLNPVRVREILRRYGDEDGIEKERIGEFYDRFKDRKYCILVFLRNPRTVRPFNIDKKGFGNMTTWIAVEDIGKIKIDS